MPRFLCSKGSRRDRRTLLPMNGGGEGGVVKWAEKIVQIQRATSAFCWRITTFYIVVAVRDACERADSVNNMKKNRAILTLPAVEASPPDPPDDRRSAAELEFRMSAAV